jgi:phosphoadenosine phosphosulfate reductase
VSELYAEGYARLGCLFCPMAYSTTRARQAQRWPKYREAFRRAFGRLYERRGDRPAFARWRNGDEMFEWWLRDKGDDDADQRVLFE